MVLISVYDGISLGLALKVDYFEVKSSSFQCHFKVKTGRMYVHFFVLFSVFKTVCWREMLATGYTWI